MALIDMLPSNYKGSEQSSDIQNALSIQVKKAQNARDDLLLQLNVETATWGLAIWEKAFALTTDVTKSFDSRRSRIESKLRSQGVTTKAMIRNVAVSFSDDAVDVIEYPAEYRFEIKFTGIPPNVDDLESTIEEIKPAHLAWAYIYIMQGAMAFGGTTAAGDAACVLPEIPASINPQCAFAAGSSELSGESALIFPDTSDEVKTQCALTAGSSALSGESAVVFPDTGGSVQNCQIIMACFLSIGEHATIT